MPARPTLRSRLSLSPLSILSRPGTMSNHPLHPPPPPPLHFTWTETRSSRQIGHFYDFSPPLSFSLYCPCVQGRVRAAAATSLLLFFLCVSVRSLELLFLYVAHPMQSGALNHARDQPGSLFSLSLLSLVDVYRLFCSLPRRTETRRQKTTL